MKILTIMILGLLVVGCEKKLTPEQQQKALRDNLVGRYTWNKRGFKSEKRVLLENGIIEKWYGYEKLGEGKWSIVDGELHAIYGDSNIVVYSFIVGGPESLFDNITTIAKIVDGKRTDNPKGVGTRYDKIK